MSDETTTGQHELIVGKFDPYSDEVAITRDGIVLAHVYGNDGGAVKALALDFVLGRERAQKAEDENARLRERVAALELSMRLAATRMDILVGRMRGCHEVTGMHELLDEAEMFVQEARAALAQADETGGGAR